MNWRHPVILTLLYSSGSRIPHILNEIQSVNKYNLKEIIAYQKQKLKIILKHAYDNVPYYQNLLSDLDIVIDGEVNLNNFHKIPLLTKKIIRKEGVNLYARDYEQRQPFVNTSGGSTGEPVKFIQDKSYDEWNTATKIFFNKKLGKRMGEKEIKLWGSDRDILEGNLKFKDRVINYLYNRKFYNCYTFGTRNMAELVNLNNSFKPITYWAYVDGILEFSKFILKNYITLNSPKFIVTTIGHLNQDNREIIEKAFGCKVFNQYGSREMGSIACQDLNQNELNVFFWRILVEIEDIKEDYLSNQGKLVLTSLDNFSMPLIRYEIGDVALKGKRFYAINKTKSYISIKDIIGRTLGFFIMRDGTLKHTHFLVQQLFFKNWIKKFKLIQKDYDFIEIEVVGERDDEDIKEITKNIEIFMGTDCKIKFNFVDEIESTKSGKFLYTVSEIQPKDEF